MLWSSGGNTLPSWLLSSKELFYLVGSFDILKDTWSQMHGHPQQEALPMHWSLGLTDTVSSDKSYSLPTQHARLSVAPL